MSPPGGVADLTALLRDGGYLADRGLATAVHVALALDRPLLLEGEPGVGKTEIARVLAAVLGRQLIRLQCYEGIDTHQALYEWDYARQMLQIRLLSEDGDRAVEQLFGPGFLLERPLLSAIRALGDAGGSVTALYGPEFLLERPLLHALRTGSGAVLLIDEIDRADDEFEAFLLELLSDFQVSIPELGTMKAERRPLVVITSNRTRELHDALKRRCLYHWIDYPDPEREAEIVRARLPQVPESVALRVCDAVARLRDEELYKLPGVG